MNLRRNFSAIILLSICGLYGCSQSGKEQGQPIKQISGVGTPIAEQTVVVEPTPTTAKKPGNCENRYYPVVLNSMWTYKGKNPVTGDFSFTRSIIKISDDGFEDSDTWDSGLIRTGTWTCSQGNLTGLNQGGAATVSIPTGNDTPKLEAESKESSGVSIPAEMKINESWEQQIKLLGKMTMLQGSMQVSVANETNIKCTPMGEEEVTVQAGVFKAMRVVCPSSISISIDNNPSSTMNGSSTIWYSAGVGVVKMAEDSEIGKVIIELSTYNIPVSK